MGEVYRAEHRLLARPAAIKLVRPELLGVPAPERARVLQRFEREARATARLRSAHTIDVYDYGIADDGTFYYVMELLDGLDLETLLERHGPQPPGRVVHLLSQACRSLEDAHHHGMLHRDVKPANIFVCRHGRDYDFVKVLDFGLVKASAAGGVEHHTLTREHTAMGTPAFMSPEQVVGQDTVDARSDIYAVGCVAYWLVTGVLVLSLYWQAISIWVPFLSPNRKTGSGWMGVLARFRYLT